MTQKKDIKTIFGFTAISVLITNIYMLLVHFHVLPLLASAEIDTFWLACWQVLAQIWNWLYFRQHLACRASSSTLRINKLIFPAGTTIHLYPRWAILIHAVIKKPLHIFIFWYIYVPTLALMWSNHPSWRYIQTHVAESVCVVLIISSDKKDHSRAMVAPQRALYLELPFAANISHNLFN